MENHEKKEIVSVAALETIRSLISAIRAVKLYPPNNPLHAQAPGKAREALDKFLTNEAQFRMCVRDRFFMYGDTPLSLSKDGQLFNALAHELFSKGVREIVFTRGVSEAEMSNLLRGLSLSREELARTSGLSSILWEKGGAHIRIIETDLDKIVMTKTDEVHEEKHRGEVTDGQAGFEGGKKQGFSPSLVLGELMKNPSQFGVNLVQLAKETRGDGEDVNDRLYSLYQEAGRKIQEKRPEEREALYSGLANSALSLGSPYREGLIAGKLLATADFEILSEESVAPDGHLPSALDEILTSRFSGTWPEKHISLLLKKAARKKEPESTSPLFEVDVVAADLEAVKGLSEYTPEEISALKKMSQAGFESDITEAAAETLLSVLSLVQQDDNSERQRELFGSIIHHLEETAADILRDKNYDLAALIVETLLRPLEESFRPRMAEAIKRIATRPAITAIIGDMKKQGTNSPEYDSARAFLSLIERESTGTLLELLAADPQPDIWKFLFDLLKDIGKNQISFIGEHIDDNRADMVSNIIRVLSESQSDHAIAFLQKAANHTNVQVRHEVIKGLVAIGGKKAAALLAKYLHDGNDDIKLSAIRGLAGIPGITADEIKPVIAFLSDRPSGRKDEVMTFEAFKALGRVGDKQAADFLTRYDTIRWWKPKKPQLALRAASLRAREEIRRREVNGRSGEGQPH